MLERDREEVVLMMRKNPRKANTLFFSSAARPLNSSPPGSRAYWISKPILFYNRHIKPASSSPWPSSYLHSFLNVQQRLLIKLTFIGSLAYVWLPFYLFSGFHLTMRRRPTKNNHSLAFKSISSVQYQNTNWRTEDCDYRIKEYPQLNINYM